MAQLSLLSAAALRLFSTDGLSGGTYTTTSRFSRPGRDVPATKLFAAGVKKTFASAPGQLPRDVVSVPVGKGPLRGNPRRPGRQKELRSSGK
ncbi:hypothetical protein ACP0HM_35660 [Escherichia coli]